MTITKQRILFVLVALCMSFSCSVFADDRTADEVLAEIDSIKIPTYDRSRRSDRVFMAKLMKETKVLNIKKAKLIGELYIITPDHEKLNKLMSFRWRTLYSDTKVAAVLLEEMQAIYSTTKDTEFAKEARYAYANKTLYDSNNSPKKNLEAAAKAIDSFISLYPKDSRSLLMIKNLARAYEPGAREQLALYNRIKKEYPDESKFIDIKIKQAKSIGKPFELEFQDAITGTQINMKDLKGQVVVIDFWATWCGPCKKEIPRLKELYAKYHDKGVQFIGISLDKSEELGGLAKLKKYVKEKEIPWPQYYQGDGWASKFSKSWGINSIPALFVVDKKGNLKSVKARGRLEKLIPDLLAE